MEFFAELRSDHEHDFDFREGAIEGETTGRASGLAERTAELETMGVTKSSIKGQSEGRERGRNEGRAEGLASGRTEGRTAGQNQGKSQGQIAGEVNERITTLELVLADNNIRLSAEDILYLRELRLDAIPTIASAKFIKSRTELWHVVGRNLHNPSTARTTPQ